MRCSALVLSLLCSVGCAQIAGIDDWSPSGLAGAGSGGGTTEGGSGGGGPGGTGTGGTCGLGEQCVPAAPAGWSGPAAFALGASTPSCAAPFPTEVPSLGAGSVSGDDATCAGCVCSADILCSVTVGLYGDSMCNTPAGDVVLEDSACTPFATKTISSVKVALGPAVTSCKPSGGGVMAMSPAAFEQPARLCEGRSGGSCGAGMCAPAVDAPFALCVHREGDVPCDGEAYSERTSLITAIEDTRTCTPCGCGDVMSPLCNDAPLVVQGWENDMCTASSSFASGPGCKNLLGVYLVSSLQMTPPAASGSCSVASPSVPTGGVAPSSTITVCCLPR